MAGNSSSSLQALFSCAARMRWEKGLVSPAFTSRSHRAWKSKGQVHLVTCSESGSVDLNRFSD